jgi:hypothetical protein
MLDRDMVIGTRKRRVDQRRRAISRACSLDVGFINDLVTVDEPGAAPRNGSGYMHVVAFDGDDCPDAVTLLSYSQSSDTHSAHHSDQTPLYSQKKWVQSRFCEADIAASTTEIIPLEPAPCATRSRRALWFCAIEPEGLAMGCGSKTRDGQLGTHPVPR